MKYNNIVEGIFINRPNRFIANVLIDGLPERVHVPNTGRCKEILKEGTKVYLEKSNNPNRKTRYSLRSVYKKDLLINIDSQIPNDVVYDSISSNKMSELLNIDYLKREVTYGNSRFDMYFEKGEKKGFIEVKGVTLENNGISMFPDAPTERGTKHVLEMIKALDSGYKGYIVFLIQMEGIYTFEPHTRMDPDFTRALLEADKKGVNVIAYNSIVTKDSIVLNEKVEVLI